MSFARLTRNLLSFGCAAWLAATSAAQAQPLTQAQAAALFDKVCLQTAADPSAVAKAARRAGLKQIDPTHWSSSDTGINIAVFSKTTKNERSRVDLEELTKDRKTVVEYSPSFLADYKGRGIGCALTVYGTPINGLAAATAQFAAKYGAAMKVNRAKTVGRAKFVLGGEKSAIVTRPFRISGTVSFAFLAVVRGR